MILERMDAALVTLERRWPKRRPKAFYLTPDDWTEAMAVHSGDTVRTMFGNNPPRERVDPAYKGLPVRESKGKQSRLYDSTQQGHDL